ncbi:PREDICTED: uncharacterized protein LOC109181758 isoform X2 [Ipomoea nil]|uniref:uncharacterized protein LOC109181758 isoform X2 n=1 Tax=Ipomoea nil TaxID=35883 RepID=UPI000900F386|nr:PREDICTED: uncharacterized protein LOC109181758 isoform X2 [Ipomoea nil]
MAARYGFGGKASVNEDDMKGRYVFGGGYKGKGRNNLRDTLDKFGKVKDFLNHDDTEMVVPTNLSRPGPNMATRPSWPKLTNFGQMMMVTKKEDDDDDEKGNQESFTPADKAAEDSSKKRPNNKFCLQDQGDVDSIIVPNINLGSNPYPNNNVIKPTNYRGTAMDPPKDDKLSYGVNNTSSNKAPPCSVNFGPKQHSDYVSDSRGQGPPYTVNFGPKQQHSDYVSDCIGQIKKQNMEMAGWVTNKPNISNGWQDYYSYEDAPLKPQGRYIYNNRAQRWKEITPNPPPQLRLRYGGAYPNLRPAYRRPVIDSNWAEKKYNGVLLTDN